MVTEVKISELPAATAANGTMQLEVNDGGTSKRVTNAQQLAYIQTVPLSDFKAAWDIDTRSLQKVSLDYNLDLRIWGFERGSQFNRDIEIHKGAVVRDRSVDYEDYDWECICPDLGG